jgi:hypothetical protein
VSNRKVSNHPSHQLIVNAPGKLRSDGSMSKPRIRRSKTLPPPYVYPQTPQANGVPIASGPMGVITGPAGPASW